MQHNEELNLLNISVLKRSFQTSLRFPVDTSHSSRIAPTCIEQARDTTDLLSQETPDFIPPQLWPPNSPDLSPVDNHICSILEWVYHTHIHDVDNLKMSLVEEWQMFDQKIIDWVIRQWHPLIRACIREGGHFEHYL